MWWHKKRDAEEIGRWAEKLESCRSSEPELAMAAELRRLRLATLHTPADFREALRENLLDQHVRRQFSGDQRGQIFGTLPTWALSSFAIIVIVMLGLTYLLRSGKTPQWIDVGVGRLIAPILRIDVWQVAMVEGTLFLLGSFFLVALLFRLFFGLRIRYGAVRVSTAYWRSVSAKAIWASLALALLLVFVTISWSATQYSQHSAVTTSLEARRRSNQAGTLYSSRKTVPLSRLGLAVGGAMDVGNFRENIDNGYLPLPTDITYEGLFYDYYFETGEPQSCGQLFCPTYAQARSRDPLSGEVEDYLAVGLTSGMAEDGFERKQLNLVVVFDISDSMSELFNRYYYDPPGSTASSTARPDEDDRTEPKIQVASKAVVAMFDHLTPEDRLGIVLFSDNATLAKSLRLVGDSDMARMADNVLGLTTDGGTNMESGYRLATKLLDEYAGVDQERYENRIILLTDAQPNAGLTDRNGLAAMMASNAERQLYTTIVGVGIDFNTDLIESVTKMRGANYYSIHSPAEFVQRMDEGFDHMVTPLVFDLRLQFDSPDAAIEAVYGSPEADAATGELMYVNTLFPSDSEEGEVKGGLLLLKLQRDAGDTDALSQATLTATYRDRSGQEHRNESTVTLRPAGETEHYDHSGIRKGILLARYAGLLKAWLGQEARSGRHTVTQLPPQRTLGTWERQSSPLDVPRDYRSMFADFAEYFEAEMEAIGDGSLRQELALLKGLAR